MAEITQFGRQVGLYVINDTNAIDLSAFKIKFETVAQDLETLNSAWIRVYNLSDQTIREIIAEYGYVALNAGYEGQLGTIFKGTITKYVKGKERNVDSFLDIYASDGDVAYNFGTVNADFAAGSDPQQQLTALANAMSLPLDSNASGVLAAAVPFGGIMPRGKVMFGMARDYMRDLANTYRLRWSIQNGFLTLVPIEGYLGTDIIQINSATGMVGTPEATQQGIQVRTLLNPLLRVGHRIQLNNKDVTQSFIKSVFYLGYQGVNELLIAQVDSGNDGFYRVIVIEHRGDTRDQDWYTNLICLLINPGGTPSVFPSGVPLK